MNTANRITAALALSAALATGCEKKDAATEQVPSKAAAAVSSTSDDTASAARATLEKKPQTAVAAPETQPRHAPDAPAATLGKRTDGMRHDLGAYEKFDLSKEEAEGQYAIKANTPWPGFSLDSQTPYQAYLGTSSELEQEEQLRKRYADLTKKNPFDENTWKEEYATWRKEQLTK